MHTYVLVIFFCEIATFISRMLSFHEFFLSNIINFFVQSFISKMRLIAPDCIKVRLELASESESVETSSGFA